LRRKRVVAEDGHGAMWLNGNAPVVMRSDREDRRHSSFVSLEGERPLWSHWKVPLVPVCGTKASNPRSLDRESIAARA
jgi:hypothetical protein